MRKPRNLDGELRALEERARILKAKRTTQLGELVLVCGAGQLDAEILAGVLLAAVNTRDPQIYLSWRRRGEAFFQGEGTLSAPSGSSLDHPSSGQDAGSDPAGRSGQGAD